MLVNLTITNLAIIDHLDVQFEEGFSVLTGETGAGKSIILDAFGLLLGDRARPELVRSGASEATVQALFDLSGLDQVRQSFQEAGFQLADELVLRRVVQPNGRSRAYINGALATLSQLQPLSEQLVSVSGQHEHQTLLQRQAHIKIIDQCGLLIADLNVYREVYRQMCDAQAKLEKIDSSEKERAQKLDYLKHLSAEIEAAKLSLDEEDTIMEERRRLQNAERLHAVNQSAYEDLYGRTGAVCEVLSQISSNLTSLLEVDSNLVPLHDSIQKHLFEIEDVAMQMRSYAEKIVFDPERIDEIEARLSLISRLKRKHGSSIEAILGAQNAFDKEIAELEQANDTKSRLFEEYEHLQQKVMSLGRQLSEKRKGAANKIVAQLSRELSELAMSGAKFDVMFTELDRPGPEGLEKLEFFVSLNPGEPLMPLSKVASGGELSRIMLAIKRVAPDAERVATIIYDEVDAGIGGIAATAVGRKLQNVGQAAQVICVTHLPQVAAFADHHYRVLKREKEGRTIASLEHLTEEARVGEMARMLGGSQITEQSLLHARELISFSSKK